MPSPYAVKQDSKQALRVCPHCLDPIGDLTKSNVSGGKTPAHGWPRIQTQSRTRARRRSKNRAGLWWKKLGYAGPVYCQRCSEVFRDHIVRGNHNNENCDLITPCRKCRKVLVQCDQAVLKRGIMIAQCRRLSHTPRVVATKQLSSALRQPRQEDRPQDRERSLGDTKLGTICNPQPAPSLGSRILTGVALVPVTPVPGSLSRPLSVPVPCPYREQTQQGSLACFGREMLLQVHEHHTERSALVIPGAIQSKAQTLRRPLEQQSGAASSVSAVAATTSTFSKCPRLTAQCLKLEAHVFPRLSTFPNHGPQCSTSTVALQWHPRSAELGVFSSPALQTMPLYPITTQQRVPIPVTGRPQQRLSFAARGPDAVWF